MNQSLFEPIKVGSLLLKNRIVMAPMTRHRANQDGVPSDLSVLYYEQRSSSGMIITEGTSPSYDGDGYPRVPGIYTESQKVAWKKVTKAVHAQNGKIFLQIMHVGRVAHSINKHPTAETVAPSAIKVSGQIFTEQLGFQNMITPRALATYEIKNVIEEYRQATKNALSCGFDGVELHAAYGYLPMQFLSSNSNLRTDLYGGSALKRIRFVVEVLEAMTGVMGSDKIGLRISPASELNDMHDFDPIETYTELLKAIDSLDLAYLHVVLPIIENINILNLINNYYNGIKILNGGFNFKSGSEAIKHGDASLISYGMPFIANPDLVERFFNNTPLNSADINTLYTAGEEGYTDYPVSQTN